MGYSRARVRGVDDLTPNLRRLTFDVADLPGLGLPGVADEAVGIYFPAESQRSTPDMQCRDGIWAYYDLDPAPDGRNYSIRAADPAAGTVVVDFVIHAAGPATTWAQRTEPGHEVVMTHARSWFAPPTGTGRLVLAADLAGLPALARIIEALPVVDCVTVVAEVPSPTDLAYLPERKVETITLIGGNGRTPSRLAETVAALDLPDAAGYCWFAGEASESRAVRKHLRSELRWGRESYDVIGYWRQDSERWTQAYSERSTELFAVYRQALAEGKTEKEASEEFDEALERVGL
ncbi:putative siderophore-interacting protein [Gordonia namibiensis NBRC 108229]|uniref:Putative siderophore-interacting protein n=1 Tax=Gordonia namibiensis NBRC 108229 TaxID=1208314 RepID=K6XAG0_9ACTN|nr:siderophore-interacting protein [Gordonia namibiensis]GAC01358.1 putative siderophore-interacting protein [Gordonia namibiensis NBRC 108229]